MTQTADRMARILAATPLRLANLSDAEAAARPAPDQWSKKEILGHLIDSAANNHQRFVGAQLASAYAGPSYEQKDWVAAQAYASESWPDLVNLWLLYNRHLLHIVRHLPESALAVICTIGNDAPAPLAEIVSGYLDHMEHHLSQILG